MELSLVLDPPVAPSPEAKAPGTDPNDPASQAFAVLLAALVGGITPPPEVVPMDSTPGTPPSTDTPSVALATAPELQLPFSAPSGRDVRGDSDQKLQVAPTAAPKAGVAPPMVPVTPVAIDTDEPEPEPEPDSVAPAIDAKPAALKPTTSHPSAGGAPAPTPVVEPPLIAPISSPSAPQEGGGRDENEERPQVTVTATAAPTGREVAAPAKPFTLEAATAPAPTAAPSPPAASPAEQVVKAVAPLRKLADGTHHVVLELHPAELGAVRVELSLDAGTVHLGIHAEVASTAQALHAAMPELRSQLDAAGLVAGRLDIDSGAADQRRGRATWQENGDRAGRRELTNDTPEVVTLERTRALAAPGHVDVLL